ncbi:MAG: hypothetical protein C0404_03695 [Verrucomicrobia bacterium]|nr:hypothetical protein [Verrucomicrobiota bacterium]
MVFSSSIFIYVFLPLTLLVYYLLPGKWRNACILLASLLFYYWGSNAHIWLLVFCIVSNYALGIAIDSEKIPQKRKRIMILAVVINLVLLFHYKYTTFAVGQVNALFGPVLNLPAIALPVGISFFIFQAMSYIVDLYQGRIHVQKNLLDFAMYKSSFPQLIAGPIVRYKDVESQITGRTHSVEKFFHGLCRFVTGLAKKLIIANALGRVTDAIVGLPHDQISTSVAWLGIICYAFQIYYDFSGYSDMAIGIGKMLGFEFLENFNYPYISRSMREFWRRWHISLSGWFRDYVYLPLGGNRVSPLRQHGNLLLVFFLCGFWHGASWNFLVWGMFHGVFLTLEHTRWRQWLDRLPRAVQHVYVIGILCVSWAFFRIENIHSALGMVKRMFLYSSEPRKCVNLGEFLTTEVATYLALAALFSTPVVPALRQMYARLVERHRNSQYYTDVLTSVREFGLVLYVFVMLGLSMLMLASSSYNPFIYFRF